MKTVESAVSNKVNFSQTGAREIRAQRLHPRWFTMSFAASRIII